jgi:hypothetical protein
MHSAGLVVVLVLVPAALAATILVGATQDHGNQFGWMSANVRVWDPSSGDIVATLPPPTICDY